MKAGSYPLILDLTDLLSLSPQTSVSRASLGESTHVVYFNSNQSPLSMLLKGALVKVRKMR